MAENMKRIKSDKVLGKLSKSVKKRLDTSPHKLEDYEPGATREEFLNNLKKVASTRKSSEI